MRRQEIINAVMERMEGIGNNVYDWRVSTFHEEELPIIIVRDIESSAEYPIGCKTNHKLSVSVEIIDSPESENMSEMRGKIGTVIKKFMSDDGEYPLLETDRRYISSHFNAEMQDRYIVSAAVDFEINYITNINEI